MDKDTQLPAEVEAELKINAKEYASELTFNAAWVDAGKIDELRTTAAEDWEAGATEYAAKLHEAQAQATLIANKGYEWEKKYYKEQEENETARTLLHEILVMNEMWGDLPGEYINKIKTFLDGK